MPDHARMRAVFFQYGARLFRFKPYSPGLSASKLCSTRLLGFKPYSATLFGFKLYSTRLLASKPHSARSLAFNELLRAALRACWVMVRGSGLRVPPGTPMETRSKRLVLATSVARHVQAPSAEKVTHCRAASCCHLVVEVRNAQPPD